MSSTYVIQNPGLQSRGQRWLSTFLRILAATLWIRVATAVVTLVAWLVGIEYFQHMLQAAHVEAITAHAILVTTTLIAAFALMGLWAFYNHRRFDAADRRDAPQALSPAQMAAAFDVSTDTVDSLQGAARMEVAICPAGRMSAVSTLPLREAANEAEAVIPNHQDWASGRDLVAAQALGRRPVRSRKVA